MKFFTTFALITLSISAFALDPYLTRSSGNMCYYDDGSVINNGGRICPMRLSSNNGTSGITVPNLGPSQESIDWRLKYGQDRAQGLSAGTRGLLGSLSDKIKERKLREVLDDHPNSKSTLQSPEFLEWVSKQGKRDTHLKQAYSGNAKSLDSLLTAYNFETLATSNPDFIAWIIGKYGKDEARKLISRADKTGDYSVLKSWPREFRKSTN
ncbi:hypothetical protein N9M56_06495 [Porticoccaceae bacterium]|jgi:hypothetical protein|nr:hypothetical protein [Porticoccaceae bacterium]MDA9565643.1 hypothetical protein [Porticoccaceae bacterium]